MSTIYPEGSTPERHALETARIAEVFGLTGGELADEVWTETAAHEVSGTLYEVKSHWWYEGVPAWAEADYVDSPYEYRTMVRDCLFGNPPARLSGKWEFVAAYQSSGETECHHRDAGIADANCQLCEGDGFVYLGDGWAEVVYRRED